MLDGRVGRRRPLFSRAGPPVRTSRLCRDLASNAGPHPPRVSFLSKPGRGVLRYFCADLRDADLHGDFWAGVTVPAGRCRIQSTTIGKGNA